MAYIHRTYQTSHDYERMNHLIETHPESMIHTVDLPYRLSSWAFDDEQNTRLWFNQAGQLMAWAVLQLPFWVIDYAIHPIAEAVLHQTILAWAEERINTLQKTEHARPIWLINVFDNQQHRRSELEASGWQNQADVGEYSWSKVFMTRPATPPVSLVVSQGFTIRR